MIVLLLSTKNIMESTKKWLNERNSKKNGLYVHYSPPNFGAISGAQLRTWARGGDEGKLERAVLAGHGRRLLAEADSLQLSHHLPALVAKCDALHKAVERGSLLELQELLDREYNRRKYVSCCDEAGVGLLHKAVYYDFMDIAQYLVDNYPHTVHQKDSEGRTALHYTALCADSAGAAALLERAGAARGARDAAGHSPAYYRGVARTLLALPVAPATTAAADMARDPAKNTPGLVIKRHNIRIWCHDCDMARLQRVVWEGHGSRLLSEVSNQPIVKRFLEAVPYIMNTVRDIHQAVVQNDLESVMKNSSDPVPPQILSSRDSNNMTVMHKAAGLGHSSILKYLVERYPQGINDIDNDGRTPLHYAACMRDEQHTYNLLVELGADESVVDNKNKTPAYYINRPQEIDKSLFKNVPDAPRTASSAYPSNWDWKLLDNDVIADLNKKSRRRNLKASTENLLSKNYSNTISESTDNRNDAMKPSSTHEFIKDLPDLDDTNKENKDETEESNEEEGIKKESDDNEVNSAEDHVNENNDNEEKRENEETEVAEENHTIENINDGVENHNPEESKDAAKNQDTEQNENDIKKQSIEEKTESTENAEVIQNSGEDSTEKESEKAKPPESSAHDTEKKGSNDENIEPKEANSEQTSDNTEGNMANTEQNTENTERHTETIEHNTTNINENTESTVQITEISDVDKENTVQGTDKTENTHNTDNIEYIADKTDELKENTENLQTNEDTIKKSGGNENTKDNALSESTLVRPKTATKVPAATEVSSGNNNTHEDDVNKSGKFNEINHISSSEDKVINDMAKNDVDPKVGKYEISHSLEMQNNNESQNDAESIDKSGTKIEETSKIEEDSKMEETSKIEDENAYQIFTSPDKRNGEHKDNMTEDVKDTKSLSAKSRSKTPGGDVSSTILNEGNNNVEHNEDDDDVQVQGDSHSEYSDSNNKSTAEVRDLGSAKRGHVINGRNTQESLIEGIISGEAEPDSQDASITQGKGSIQREVLVVDNEIDPEVTDLINNANMEMLATLVLNGEGARLMGRHSENLELQAFLDNVPTYMQKINKVHIAAKEGNIRDLQSALDRRKFAIARDPISANGATPLHVATVFGKTNIIKYLGGRFPETLSSVDFEGRTALHYAAVLPDNGHYYTLLQQLGANSKDLDDNGRSAEDYFKNPYLLPFEHLLSDFGLSEEEVKSMFSDKGTSIATNGHMDIPIFKTEEGRYLAQCKLNKNIIIKMEQMKDEDVYTDTVFTALGDPLIKGLTEVANIKPKDPVAFLASFLQNFPESEKPTIDTQETNMVLTEEVAEVENEEVSQESTAETVAMNGSRSGARTTTRSHRPIDVVTVDPQTVVSPDAPETAFSSANRDEHGQSMLHFAAARTHARNALFQLLQESEISLAYRDELYRTARDVSIQANVPENTAEIDKWVLHLAAKGNTEKIMGLLLEGYDHILDVVDEEGVPIVDVVTQRDDTEMSKLLESIPTFEESRDNLHGAVRRGDLSAVRDLVLAEGGRTLARSQNSFGRTALHIAVLVQHEDIVAYLAQTCPELLRIGDNLERTPLHYAMGVEKIESLSRILIRAGAKRVLKDLKGRQPSYYFMNKSDILRLKEEEEVY